MTEKLNVLILKNLTEKIYIKAKKLKYSTFYYQGIARDKQSLLIIFCLSVLMMLSVLMIFSTNIRLYFKC